MRQLTLHDVNLLEYLTLRKVDAVMQLQVTWKLGKVLEIC